MILGPMADSVRADSPVDRAATSDRVVLAMANRALALVRAHKAAEMAGAAISTPVVDSPAVVGSAEADGAVAEDSAAAVDAVVVGEVVAADASRA